MQCEDLCLATVERLWAPSLGLEMAGDWVEIERVGTDRRGGSNGAACDYMPIGGTTKTGRVHGSTKLSPPPQMRPTWL